MLFLCIKIFFARILDVSLGTVRTMLTVKGKSIAASMVGFIEVTIWFLIVKEALNTSEANFWVVFSYAGGYATGTFIGGMLSQKFIKGNLGVQVVTSDPDHNMVSTLRQAGYAVSVIDVKGHDENVAKYMLFIEINNKHLEDVKRLIKSIDERAFIVVNETKMVQNGYFK